MEKNNEYIIGGVTVEFPYKPYPSQISMMNHIIKALNEKENSLLESPTGSGKTLSLLCSTLAWQKNYKMKKNNENNVKEEEEELIEKIPQIFYCTRTHKQLSQVISELKTTIYGKKDLNMTILSSREHSCINGEVLKKSKNNKDISEACQELIKNPRNSNDTCKFYRGMDKIASHNNLKKYKFEGAFDIEEYVSLGKKCKSCPFFASKQLTNTSDLILCPYNYIIDPIIRSSMEMNIKNSIIIIDEAHNVEDVCRSSMSLTFTEKQITNCLIDIKGLIEIYNDNCSIKNIYEGIQGFMCSMEHWLKSFDNKCIQISFETDRYVIKGKEGVTTLLENAGINIQTVAMLDEFLDKLRVFKENEIANNSTYNINDEYIPEMTNTSKNLIQSCLVVLNNFLIKDNCNDYVISLSKERIIITDKILFDRSYRKRTNINQNIQEFQLTCTFICLNPSLAFCMIEKDTHSILLASGTLSPMNSFGPELGVNFKIIYEANYMNSNKQAYVAGLCVGPNNTPMKLTYQFYNQLEIQDKIGKIINDVCKTVLQGVLCFLPSFNILEMLIKRWEKINLWQNLNNIKHVFVESRRCSHNDYEKMIKEYSDCSFGKYDNTIKKGSLMFAVCRGRSSEGIDFSDNMARAVITIGIPFPNIKTADISEKMLYNDIRCQNSEKLYLDGREWYNIQAFRAINQAIGRCIRHKDDWGAIILLDARFDNLKNRNSATNKLSKWVRDKLQSFYNYSIFLKQLEEFIKSKQDVINISKIELQNNYSIISDDSDFEIKNKNILSDRKNESKSRSLSPVIVSNSKDHNLLISNSTFINSEIILHDITENTKKEFDIIEDVKLIETDLKITTEIKMETIELCHLCKNTIKLEKSKIKKINDTCKFAKYLISRMKKVIKFELQPVELNKHFKYVNSFEEINEINEKNKILQISDMFNSVCCIQDSKLSFHIPLVCIKCNNDQVTCWKTIESHDINTIDQNKDKVFVILFL